MGVTNILLGERPSRGGRNDGNKDVRKESDLFEGFYDLKTGIDAVIVRA
jgi:hypothetical protein